MTKDQKRALLEFYLDRVDAKAALECDVIDPEADVETWEISAFMADVMDRCLERELDLLDA